MDKKVLWRYTPLIIFILLSLFLYIGLHLNPNAIPSTMINKPLPSLKLPLLSSQKGAHFDINEYKGKVWLLNVWASWCLACQEEHPVLMDLAHEKITIVGLDYKDSKKKALAWLSLSGTPYQSVLFDKKGDRAIDLGVYGAPETFVIDKNLKIRYKHVGVMTKEIWLNQIKPLVQKLGSSS